MARRFLYLRTYLQWSVWAVGAIRQRTIYDPNKLPSTEPILTLCVGPFRIQFLDLAARWKPYHRGAL
jgi:hypothetical protein